MNACGSSSGGTTNQAIQAPSNLTYPQSTITATENVAIAMDTPTLTGTATSFGISPALPAGLSLNTSTGAISGTPTAMAASASYTVMATNSAGNATTILQITVNAPVQVQAPSDLVYPQTTIAATENVAIATDTPTVTGTVTGYSINPPLPAGLSLSSTTGAISGTPTVTATAASYTVTASNSAGNTTSVLSIGVSAPLVQAPSNLVYSTTTITATENVAIATDTPTVTGTVTGYSVNPPLPAGLSLSPTTGAISGTPTVTAASASYMVTASNSVGNTTAVVQITVNAPVVQAPSNLVYPATTITATENVAIATDTPTVTGTVTGYTVNPGLPAGLSLSPTSGAISGTPTVTAASAFYTVTASNAGGNTTAVVQITVNAPVVQAPSNLVYPATTITATENVAIATDTPTVTGTVTGYTVNPGLPTGLSLSPTTGAISGTPTATAALASYTVTASNAGGNTTAVVQITVNAPGQVPVIASFVASQTSVASGVPVMLSWSTTGATSLSIDNGVGTVTGTTSVMVAPTATTTYHLTAQNASGTAPLQAATVTVTGAVTYAHKFTSTVNLNAEDTTTVVGNDRVFMTSGQTTATQLYKITEGTAAAGPAMANNHAFTNAVALPGGNQVLVISGATSWNSNLVITSTVDLVTYDPNSDTWTATAMNPLLQGRVSFTSTLLPDGRIVIAGGQTGNSTFLTQVEIYDPSANAGKGGSTFLGNLPHDLAYHHAVYSAGLVYLVDGMSNPASPVMPSVMIINPATGTITSGTAAPAGTGFLPGWVQLADGKCLLAGGGTLSGTILTSSYLFDPAGNSGAGSFTATGNLTAGRINPIMVQLADGTVLVAGGQGSSIKPYTCVATAELFNPLGNGGAGTFTSLPNSMVTGRECAPALLPNGSVLLPGGMSGTDSSGNDVDIQTAEIFN